MNRFCLAALLGGLLAFPALARAAEPLPVEAFSRLPHFSSPALSPDGSQLAYLMSVPELDGSLLLVAQQLPLWRSERQFLLKSDSTRVRINWFDWANNRQLLVSARFADERWGVASTELRLLVVDATGEDAPRPLFEPKPHRWTPQIQDRVLDFLPDDPEHILVAWDDDEPNQPTVYRVNLDTGERQRVQRGTLKIIDWWTDRQGRLRLGAAPDHKSGETRIYHRGLDDDDWRLLFDFSAQGKDAKEALGFGSDPQTLYYTAYDGGFKALYKMRLDTQEITLAHQDPDYDVDGPLIYSSKTRDAVGIHHAPAPKGRIYWDARFASLQAEVDEALPGFHNYLDGFSRDEDTYLVHSVADTQPGVYYRGYQGKRNPKSLVLMTRQYPELGDEPLYEQRELVYAARDGLEIEAYLSLPLEAQGPLPAIVLAHRGPQTRVVRGFDYWVAFFTNRGYAVLRPNFRGSAGYGYAFSRAGTQQWGLQMQDDLTDAANWLVAEGIADKERLCIVGRSYGGYAALMATVKTPELFRCAISFAGISDLRKFIGARRGYGDQGRLNEDQIGRRSGDLKARSPLHHASEIKTPILLAHGEDDRVVDVAQSRIMAEELEDQGKQVEYLELPDGDHYLSVQANRHAFFRAMDRFLAQHLGPQ